MTQKQIVWSVVGLSLLALVFAWVYLQFSAPASRDGVLPKQEQSKTLVTERAKIAEPETIDDIAKSIDEEALSDLSALDDEVNGEMSEVEADSASVTNLGTSYDENSL